MYQTRHPALQDRAFPLIGSLFATVRDLTAGAENCLHPVRYACSKSLPTDN